jgi:hypothetical protein
MKGFKDTTKTVSGHHDVPAHQFNTFGRAPFRGNPAESAGVRRSPPRPTDELEELGGRSTLTPGYARGGSAKHFHVHKHYYSGGKVRTESKRYGSRTKRHPSAQAEADAERAAEGQITPQPMVPPQAQQPYMAKGGRWIQGAIKRPGAFTAKAKRAGMGVQAYARKVTAEGSGASTRTKRQANLAKTLKRMHKAHGGSVQGRGFRPTGNRRHATRTGVHDVTTATPVRDWKMDAPWSRASGTSGTRNRLATGGTINRLGRGGSTVTAVRVRQPPAHAAGMGTSGTRNRLGAGGALYKRGGSLSFKRWASEEQSEPAHRARGGALGKLKDEEC